MPAHDIGYMIELARTGITPDCLSSGPDLAGFLELLPEFADALADSLIELSEYIDANGLGAAGEHVAEAGVSARVMHDIAGAASAAFTRENRFWLATAAAHPASVIGELAERAMSGFIPDESDHIIDFLRQLPALAKVLQAGLHAVSEKAAGTHLGETVSSMLSDAAVQAGGIRECAFAAWGAFENDHAFWLATR